METDKKTKCQFCKVVIENGTIRCNMCNMAWQDGHKSGVEQVEDEVGQIIKRFLTKFN